MVVMMMGWGVPLVGLMVLLGVECTVVSGFVERCLPIYMFPECFSMTLHFFVGYAFVHLQRLLDSSNSTSHRLRHTQVLSKPHSVRFW